MLMLPLMPPLLLLAMRAYALLIIADNMMPMLLAMLLLMPFRFSAHAACRCFLRCCHAADTP